MTLVALCIAFFRWTSHHVRDLAFLRWPPRRRLQCSCAGCRPSPATPTLAAPAMDDRGGALAEGGGDLIVPSLAAPAMAEVGGDLAAAGMAEGRGARPVPAMHDTQPAC